MRILAFLSLLCCFFLPDTSRAEQLGSAPCVGLCVTVQQAAGGDFRTVSALKCRIDTRSCSGGGILMVEGQIVPSPLPANSRVDRWCCKCAARAKPSPAAMTRISS